MGGDWHDLGGGLTDGSESSVSLQPLARIHDTYERAWAADWIVAILMREAIQITPDVKEHIWTALTSLASAPVGERTITGLSVLLQSNDLKQALRPYCVGGAYLRGVANENGLPLECVRKIADRLGEREDFGALILICEGRGARIADQTRGRVQ